MNDEIDGQVYKKWYEKFLKYSALIKHQIETRSNLSGKTELERFENMIPKLSM